MAVLGLFLVLNSDRRVVPIRIMTGLVLVGLLSFYSLILGADSWLHLIFLISMIGISQAFAFAKQDPWLVYSQIINLLFMAAIMVIMRFGVIEPYISAEDSIVYAMITLITIFCLGSFLAILYRRNAVYYNKSAAIKSSEFIKLIDNSPNAILVIDAQTRELVHGNANLVQLFEIKKIPRNISKLIGPVFSATEYQQIDDIIEENGQWISVRELTGAKGRKLTCKIIITRIRVGKSQCNMLRIYDLSNEIEIKKSLDEAHERLELALLASQDGIWEWNLETDDIYLSSRWKEMFGYQEHELENSYDTWRKLIVKEDEDKSRNALYDFIKQRSHRFLVDERYHHKDGSIVYVESRAVRVLSEDGRTQKVVGSHTDLTQLVGAQKQLEKAMEAANAASEAKSQFLANMSHEIRTPLLSILGFAEQLLDDALPPSVHELVSIIQGSGETLNQLLLDILDFERIRQGKLELQYAPFDPGKIVYKLKKQYKHKAKEKGLRFVDKIVWEEGKQILGDELRFRQILINLLDNAIKFTEEGAVSISMKLREQKIGPMLNVRVTDSGPGIPAHFQENIFGLFTQYDPSLIRKHGGSGLGLGIVKQLVELMDGSIKLESPPEKPVSDQAAGSCFVFSIPVREVQQKPVQLEHNNKAVYTLPHSTILLAEDNPLNQRIASYALSKFGLEVITASDGLEAIDKIQSRPEIALVLMDIQMPKMDGYEASKQIKKIRPELRVIGLSANAFQQDIDRSKTVGMSGYLSKPYSKQQLFDTLKPFLRGE